MREMEELIEKYMRRLKLGGLAKCWRSVPYESNEQYIQALLEVEIHERDRNRINCIVKLGASG